MRRLIIIRVTGLVETETKSPQREITQWERMLAKEAGFNPDLWSDDALWEMMDYFEARMRGEV